MPKKYTKQAISGEGGESLIGLRASQMGHAYHSRPGLDAGIDGQLELRDPETQEATNRLLLVQSKAKARFPGEDEQGFYYAASDDDIDYWLRADLPVILVCSHPDSDEAWWRNVTEWGKDTKSRTTRKIRFDKDRDRFDASAAHKLLRLGVPETPRIAVANQPERLVSNLLEVRALPPQIYVAPTSIMSLEQAWHRLRSHGRGGNGWVLHEQSILSFRNLREPPFDVLTQAPPETFDTDEWAQTTDADRKRVFVQLLNQTLREMHDRELKRKGAFAYFKSEGDERRAPSKTSRGRAVVKRVERKKGEGHYAYRHMAAWLHFLRLAGTWYLSICPDHHFTHDGFRTSRFDSDLTTGMKRMERSAAVRQQVEFWASFLSPQPTLFDDATGSPQIEFGELLTVVADKGFADPPKASGSTKQPEALRTLW